MATLELVRPRVCHVPAAVDYGTGDQAVEWSRAHKMNLDTEQEFMLRSMLGLDAEGRYQAFEWAINAPRQNGKNEVLIARELFGVYVLGEMSIVHSAHEFKTSRRHFWRMEQVIRNNPDLLARIRRSDKGSHQMIGFRYSHGEEAVELDTGATIEFRTRTKSGMRGFDDVAVLVLDEAQILSEWAHGAMVPTLRASTASRGPQLVYSGNAADKEKDDHAIVWTRLRDRGFAAEDDFLIYMEYSLDYDTPEEVPEDVARDPVVWASVNWAMAHGRVTESHMLREIKTLGWREFIIGLLGVGDYPDTDLLANSEINLERWAECEDETAALQDPICIAFDVSPGRRTTITAAGLDGEGRKMVETIHCRTGTGWVPERMAALCEAHEVVELVCDGFGPANGIANRIEEQTGLDVHRLKTGEYADACGQFASAVEEHDLCHLGQEELTASVRGARTRPLVDRWAWSRSKSKTDPGPVISASIALWSAVDRDIGNNEIVIY